MAKPGKIPDFKKMYPEANEEIIEVLRKSERKMQYQEYDLKQERLIVDKKQGTVIVRPSREISYEHMIEKGEMILQGQIALEELVIHQMMKRQLYDAIDSLNMEEQYLIIQLFFVERKERDLAKELGISQKAVNKRRQKILKKLRKFFDKI